MKHLSHFEKITFLFLSICLILPKIFSQNNDDSTSISSTWGLCPIYNPLMPKISSPPAEKISSPFKKWFMTPLGLEREETPQLVLLTFDDGIQDWMYPYYEKIIQNVGIKSANGCPVHMTFFISHWSGDDSDPEVITNYELVNRLFNSGHEIAVHTVTHFSDKNYWKHGPTDRWIKEIGTQKKFLSSFANIPTEEINGFRAPYLSVGGDATYDALQSLGMAYDSSLFITNKYKLIWPFMLDNGYPLNFPGMNWPKKQFHGLWEFPLITFADLEGPGECVQPDFGCKRPTNSSMAFQFFMKQFKLFNSTRTLFGVYQHAYWFRESPHIFEGFLLFIEYLSGLDNVYFVTMSQALEWLKNPLTTTQLKSDKGKNLFACRPRQKMLCEPKNCTYSDASAIDGRILHFTSCGKSCPKFFPSLE